MTDRLFSLDEFDAELNRIAEMRLTNHLIIETGCKMIQHEARSLIGTYDAKPTWPQLADATQAECEGLGYAPDEPLLRTAPCEGPSNTR